MLDNEPRHRKIFRIPGREPRAHGDRRGRDKAVCLTQCDPSRGVIAAPSACAFTLLETEGGHPEASKEPPDGCLFPTARAAPALLDIDRAYVRRFREGPKCPKAIGRPSSAECVDQNGRIEKERRHVLADTTGISAALTTDPIRGVGIPLVSVVRDFPERRHDVVPAAVILQRSADRLRDERAPLAPADSAVKLSDESVVKANVHTHTHRLAHRRWALTRSRANPDPGVVVDQT